MSESVVDNLSHFIRTSPRKSKRYVPTASQRKSKSKKNIDTELYIPNLTTNDVFTTASSK